MLLVGAYLIYMAIHNRSTQWRDDGNELEKNSYVAMLLNLAAHQFDIFSKAMQMSGPEQKSESAAVSASVQQQSQGAGATHQQNADGFVKRGYLTKEGHKFKTWKRRYFCLTPVCLLVISST